MTSLSSSPFKIVMSRRSGCAALLALTIPVGLFWRLAPLHLPPFAFKYGGSALWAVAVYWAIAVLQPRWRSGRLALAAGTLALTVEVVKLVYWPPLDLFRETLAGKLLLGRFFTFGAIAAYWIAIAAVSFADDRMRSLGNPATRFNDPQHAETDAQSSRTL